MKTRAALLSALLLASCGGDDTTGDEPASVQSNAQGGGGSSSAGAAGQPGSGGQQQAAGQQASGGAPGQAGAAGGEAPAGTQVRMSHGEKGDFYAMPFPDEARVEGGLVPFEAFPDPTMQPLVAKVKKMAGEMRGHGTTSGVLFALTGPIDEAMLPTLEQSVQDDAQVSLIDVTAGSPTLGARVPVRVAFRADGGPWGAPNMLTLVPLQGAAMRPGATYAAVVRRSLADASGEPLAQAPSMKALASGARPEGMSDEAFALYEGALEALSSKGLAAADIAGLTVFTTADHTRVLLDVYAAMKQEPLPAPRSAFTLVETFDDICVYKSTIDMPVYQAGTPPFATEGGAFAFDDQGKPLLARHEEANVVVTIPRRPMPPGGYPLVVLSRTGAGGDRPLVDRGVRDKKGNALEPGTGPGRTFALSGWAGISVDGPHGGLRNVSMQDEQFLMFNVLNPEALRDNVRQSAAELALIADIAPTLTIDTSACAEAGAAEARFDGSSLALMGHSMGATIAPLTMAAQPAYRGVILSGAGGSWIENIVWKKKPVPAKNGLQVLLGVVGDYELHLHDPLLTVFQWVAEGADPPIFAPIVTAADRPNGPANILMLQGIIDNYILPPIANSTSLSFGLDLADSPLDEITPGLSAYTPLRPLLTYSGRGVVPLPASNTHDGATRVVVQHAEDGVEDGHEVAFQLEGPKHQYRCFLEGIAKKTAPPVVPAGAEHDACP